MNSKRDHYSDPNRKPSVVAVNPDGIPNELKARPQWVDWRLSWKWTDKEKTVGKWDKPPVNPHTGKLASSTNPATWATFDRALEYQAKTGVDGVGFVFHRDDPYCGVDLDNARDCEGNLKPWAKEIVAALDSYTEVSPSQTGVKIIIRGKLPDGCKHKIAIKDGELEVYDSGRYFTVTGHRLPDSPATVNERQAQIDALLVRIGMVKVAVPPSPANGDGKLSDDEIIAKAMVAKNGAKFARLWRGDTSDYNGDESRADLALCSALQFWTGPDAERIDSLFRQSGLMREKWNREDYRKRTIAKAIEGKSKHYTGRAKPSANNKTGSTANSAGENAHADQQTGAQVILDYFHERYRPVFHRGNSVCSADGSEIPMSVACAVPDSRLIERLASASDAPRYPDGNVKRSSLPGYFCKWARVAWGDLIASLPDEDTAELADDTPARDQFLSLVKNAMLTEVVLGDVIGKGGVTQTERRSLIDWCQKFAKPGPWRSIRSKKCWCKICEKTGGELELMVAVRHELFAQLHADKRLVNMGEKVFARRAARYGVGRSIKNERPHGQNAITLDSNFVSDLAANYLEDDNANAGSDQEG